GRAFEIRLVDAAEQLELGAAPQGQRPLQRGLLERVRPRERDEYPAERHACAPAADRSHYSNSGSPSGQPARARAASGESASGASPPYAADAARGRTAIEISATTAAAVMTALTAVGPKSSSAPTI